MPLPAEIVEIAVLVGNEVQFAVVMRKASFVVYVVVVFELGLVEGGICHRVIFLVAMYFG